MQMNRSITAPNQSVNVDRVRVRRARPHRVEGRVLLFLRFPRLPWSANWTRFYRAPSISGWRPDAMARESEGEWSRDYVPDKVLKGFSPVN
ncbi:hypothetical protein NL676_020648 [Syzygium grande]|nr:hypothetical protein NL676_020648 [Syzygium grande]